jgi:glycosyltransferase involved in cell wall biosynthesis
VKILVVAPQPFFTPRGTPLSVYYRTMVMAENGVNIDLLAYGEGQNVEIAGVSVIRIPRIPGVGTVPVGPSWKKLLLDVFMCAWTIALLLRHRYDVVHAHEESVFWCRFLKPVFRFRLIYDMHSSLPQQLSNFQFTKSRALIRTFQALEDTCLRRADAVVTICPDLRDYALRTGVDPSRHLLIENSIFEDVHLINSGDEYDDSSRPARTASAPIDKSRPIVLYAGTFEYYQGIEVLIHAFAAVHAERPDVQLMLVGGTPIQVAAAAAVIARLNLSAAVYLQGRVSKSTAMSYTAMADVLVSPRLHGTNTPLKIYEQLASGKPLVATRIWSHTQVLNDTVCIMVDPDSQSIAQGVLRALSDPENSRKVAIQAQALYQREYARPSYERKIKRLLEIVS